MTTSPGVSSSSVVSTTRPAMRSLSLKMRKARNEFMKRSIVLWQVRLWPSDPAGPPQWLRIRRNLPHKELSIDRWILWADSGPGKPSSVSDVLPIDPEGQRTEANHQHAEQH